MPPPPPKNKACTEKVWFREVWYTICPEELSLFTFSEGFCVGDWLSDLGFCFNRLMLWRCVVDCFLVRISLLQVRFAAGYGCFLRWNWRWYDIDLYIHQTKSMSTFDVYTPRGFTLRRPPPKKSYTKRRSRSFLKSDNNLIFFETKVSQFCWINHCRPTQDGNLFFMFCFCLPVNLTLRFSWYHFTRDFFLVDVCCFSTIRG